jgi:hypothetical protein
MTYSFLNMAGVCDTELASVVECKKSLWWGFGYLLGKSVEYLLLSLNSNPTMLPKARGRMTTVTDARHLRCVLDHPSKISNITGDGEIIYLWYRMHTMYAEYSFEIP